MSFAELAEAYTRNYIEGLITQGEFVEAMILAHLEAERDASQIPASF